MGSDTWERRVRRFEASFDYANSADWRKTEDLKARIGAFRSRHPNEGLSFDLLQRLVDWKLRKQRGRTEKHRKALTEGLWKGVTRCALALEHSDPNLLASVQVGVLASLPGVGIGLATAVLALTFPERHAVVDYRVWKVVFGQDKRKFTPLDYVSYLDAVRPFANEVGWPVQKADFMIWSL